MEYYWYIILLRVALEIVPLTIRVIFGRNNQPWQNGNGCNFVKWFGFDSPCCIEHDRAYKAGGWVLARLQADIALFRCIWNQKGAIAKILAIAMFPFIRFFGGISFQFGRKRLI